MDDIDTVDEIVEDEPLTLAQRRRDALLADFLLFCCAFTAGALFYGVVTTAVGGADALTVGLSEDLVFAGLLAAEVFVLWNNGWRQGARGHSIGKHRSGLAVVDVRTQQPTGPWRGLLRGLVVVLLADLSLAALPIDLPTVIRRVTPDAWHLGFVTYVALAVLVVSALLTTHRRVADRITSTSVVETDSPTEGMHRRLGTGLEVLGVVGVLGLATFYIVAFSPLIRVTGLW